MNASRVLPIIGAVIAIGVFIVDTVTAAEIAAALLYVGVVLLSASFLQKPGVVIVASGCMALTVLSYFLSPLETSQTVALSNRFLSLVAIGATAFLAVQSQSRETALREQVGLLDLTHDTMFVRRMDNVITYWNRGAEEQYGWRKEEAVGKASHQLLQTIFPARIEEIDAALLRDGRWEGELIHTKRDGTRITVASRWSLQRDDKGQATAILESNNDITERKRAEEERRYQMQLLKTVTDNASSMLFIVDAAGLGTFVNPSFERITGYRVEELIGQVVHDKVHHTKPDGTPYPVQECPWTGAVRGRRIVRGEDLFARKDGTFFPVRCTASPVFRDGVGVGTVIEVQDLTETKAAEAELRNQAQLLHLANDPIIVRGPEGLITFWNEGAVKTYGWTADEAIGRAGHELLQTRFPVPRRAVEATLQERGEWQGELTHVTRQGATIVVTSRQSLQRDERGACAAILEINRDITERKRAAEALRVAQAELSRVNRVATMGQLTASIAHEVNQPIGTARNNARAALYFLDRSPPDLKEVREALGCVVQDIDRAGEIIGRIRDHMKKAPPRKGSVHLNGAITEVIALARTELAKQEVSVQTRLTEGLPPVQGDRVQLQQVVLNLILNAIDAMSSISNGRRDLLVSTEQSPTHSVLVAVRDSGSGIDPEHLERIFEAFYTTKPSGMGMGLAICRSIIDAHEGRLWAAANEPLGTVFQFTLPAATGSS